MANNEREQWLGGLRAWASDAQAVLENIAKGVIIIAMLGSMIYFGVKADPPTTGVHAPIADRRLHRPR